MTRKLLRWRTCFKNESSTSHSKQNAISNLNNNNTGGQDNNREQEVQSNQIPLQLNVVFLNIVQIGSIKESSSKISKSDFPHLLKKVQSLYY